MTAKDRVFAAAEQISGERNPTVSRVREAAGVSNADATKYLKQWREESAAAGNQIATTPPAVLEHAARVAGTVWTEAVKLATERHAVVETQWDRERRDMEQELAELVADLDRTVEDKDRQVAGLSTELEAANKKLQVAESNAAEAATATDGIRDQIGQLTADLAAANARTETLQQTLDALVQRVNPAAHHPVQAKD